MQTLLRYCIDAGCEIITLVLSYSGRDAGESCRMMNMVRADLADELVDQLLAAVEAAK